MPLLLLGTIYIFADLNRSHYILQRKTRTILFAYRFRISIPCCAIVTLPLSYLFFNINPCVCVYLVFYSVFFFYPCVFAIAVTPPLVHKHTNKLYFFFCFIFPFFAYSFLSTLVLLCVHRYNGIRWRFLIVGSLIFPHGNGLKTFVDTK